MRNPDNTVLPQPPAGTDRIPWQKPCMRIADAADAEAGLGVAPDGLVPGTPVS